VNTRPPASRILIVDDEPNLRKVLGALLQQCGYEVLAEVDGLAALQRIRSLPADTFDAIVSDLRMPRLDGMGLLRELRKELPNVPVIFLTAHGSVDTAVEAVKAGAFDFLEKPFEREQIDQVVAKAVAQHRRSGPSASIAPIESNSSPDVGTSAATAALFDDIGMVGESAAMQAVREMVSTVAATPSTVLITGESGTGKELVAQALHRGSNRNAKPFIRINCAAIPAGLVESELFGHERGAFTGAVSSRAGRFELADDGTLFLDEVSEIPLEIQVKLLRAIQESEFERVGSPKTQRVDVRLIAATNRDLQSEIKEKRFREDLFYRLNVVPVHLPPLRERPEDIPHLVSHFVARANSRLDKSVAGFEPTALTALQSYPWPGNIRELENLVERMVLFAPGDAIALDQLPETFLRANRGPGELSPEMDPEPGEQQYIRLPLTSLGLDLKEAVRTGSRLVEEALIREALTQTDTNVTRSARLLGISRRSLQSKMKELGLRDDPEVGKNS
jgi:DNA-binding NtrC family response regulator